MTDVVSVPVVERDGFAVGPTRAPRNRAMPRPGGQPRPGAAGSIHDDVVATRLGFRGGTIAGSIHMDQFPPVLLHVFGPAWFETGSLSLGFVNATISDDEVIAMVEVPARDRAAAARVRTKMERPDGTLVAEGTASVGPIDVDAPSHLSSIDLRGGATGLRILGGIEPGHRLQGHEVTLDAAPLRA